MTAKEVVQKFYDMDLAKEDAAITLIHKDCELFWHSSKGFTTLNHKSISDMLEGFRKSFLSLRFQLSHLLEDTDTVTARYTVYVTPIEKPDEEEALAHFISIWEVRDNMLYKGYEISQMADENPASLTTFSEIKV